MGHCESLKSDKNNSSNNSLNQDLNKSNIVPLIPNSKTNTNINNNNSNINNNIIPSTNSNNIINNINPNNIKNSVSLAVINPQIQDPKQVSIEEGEDFLINGCFFPSSHLESSNHYIYKSNVEELKLIGPTSYPKNFIRPKGWTAIALKVSKKFDNGNDTWLGNSNINGEWYIGYHGVKTINSINNIYFMGFRKGPNNSYKDDQMIIHSQKIYT